MNGLLLSCKIFIKESLTNKINIIIFLIALLIFILSMHDQIEKNKFIRNWTGKFMPISQYGLQKVMREYAREVTIKLTICLFINCLIFNIVPIVIDEKFINSRSKIFKFLKNDLHILLTYIISSIVIYNIFMLPYWLFMLYYDLSFYYRYTAGIIFFYNLFVVSMLLILLSIYLRFEYYIFKSTFKKIFTLLSATIINMMLSVIVVDLNDVLPSLAGMIFLNVDYFSIKYMSPVYNFPYEGSPIVRDYTLIDSIKYFTIVFIPIVIIFGFISLKSINTHKRNIINSKPNMIFR